LVAVVATAERQVDRLRLTIRDPKARADVEDNFRKTITQVFSAIVVLFGGTAALVGAGLAYYGTQQTLRANGEQARRSEQTSRDLLISNQVAKGFEQLGSDKLVVRLGGIYALEGVMNTSEQYHQAVLEALSAFVRDGTKIETGDGPPATDIQAALTVIGRRATIGTGSPDLGKAYIPKADLHSADLGRAILSGAHLHLANLSGANLIVAHLHLANLSGARLLDADLNVAYLIGANLSGADLYRAHLIGAYLSGANLSFANLSFANLSGAYLSGANLSGADLSFADLRGAHEITQTQLDQACGTDVKLDPALTLNKPCPPP
jgi:uncharacterized protein YjbI with pentapeptide repeats